MKTIVMAAALLFSTSAFAALDPANYTCAELQSHLAIRGQISIQRLFGATTYTSEAECNGAQEARAHFEWAKDTSACQLGWDCYATGD
jgi:hypothetical protein